MKNVNAVVTAACVVHNDDDVLPDFVREASGTLRGLYEYYELLLIDNGSGPAFRHQVEALQRDTPNIRVVSLSRRYDRETALVAALDHAIGDYVVLLEIDGDPVELIPKFMELALAGHEVVIGESRNPRRGLRQRLLARLYYGLVNRIMEFPIREHATYFRVLSRAVVNSITRIRNKRRYLKHLNSLVGFRQTHLPYERRFRQRGARQREGTLEAVSRGVDLVISNSAVPLRMASLIGVAACAGNVLYLLYIVGVKLWRGQLAEGWLSSSIMSTTMFLAVFMILTLLAEYIYRILEETRDRPLYFVDSETTSPATSFKAAIESEKLNVV